jgi:electron transport complex protein RnfD
MGSLLGSISVEKVTAFMNNTIFSLTGAELPDGYIRLFVSGSPGIIADRGLLALLLGTVLISACRVSRSWTSGVFFGVYVLLVRIFGALPFGNALGNGDMLFAVLSGGIIPAIFLLASDPVTGPKSRIGSLLFACLAGLFSYLFRYPGMEPYGAFFAIALLNALTPLVREFERRSLYCRGISKARVQGRRGAP